MAGAEAMRRHGGHLVGIGIANGRQIVYNYALADQAPWTALIRLIGIVRIMNKLTKKSSMDVAEQSHYAPEAFDFVREGLAETVQRVHPADSGEEPPGGQRHVSGQDLARGLRDLAIRKYGIMAGAVLAHWNIHTTMDFGKIVFAMVEGGIMHKTPEDSVEDFRDVFDLDEALTAPRRPLITGTPVFDLKSS